MHIKENTTLARNPAAYRFPFVQPLDMGELKKIYIGPGHLGTNYRCHCCISVVKQRIRSMLWFVGYKPLSFYFKPNINAWFILSMFMYWKCLSFLDNKEGQSCDVVCLSTRISICPNDNFGFTSYIIAMFIIYKLILGRKTPIVFVYKLLKFSR